MSLNFNECKFIDNIDKLCQKLAKQGKVLIASADNRGIRAFPAMLDSVIGVEGYTFNDASNFGFYPEREIQAIADNSPIVIEWMEKKAIILGGTSKACALMTNKVAKIMQKSGKTYIFKELLSSSYNLPKDKSYKHESTRKQKFTSVATKNYDSKILEYIIGIIPCPDDKKQYLYAESLYRAKLGLSGEDFICIINKLLEIYNIHITEQVLAYNLFYSIYSLEKFIREKRENDR